MALNPDQRRSGPGEETPFIELLFVTVGALALLMLVLLAAAARPLPDSGCLGASDAEIADLVDRLHSWTAQLGAETIDAERTVKLRCPQQRIGSEGKPHPPVLPDFLARFCRADQEKALAKVGLTRDSLQAIAARRNAAGVAVGVCVAQLPSPGPAVCPTASDAEISGLAGRLRGWSDQLKSEIADAERALHSRCPQKIDLDRHGQLPLIPALLAQLCEADQDRALAQSGLTRSVAQTLTIRRNAAGAALRTCVVQLPRPEQPACRKDLDARERQAAVEQVRYWWAEANSFNRHLQRTAARACGGGVTGQGAAKEALTPPQLADICPEERRAILAEAGIDESQLTAAATERYRLSEALARCSEGSETITIDETTLRFAVCKAEIVEGTERLMGIAARVQEKIGSHNRIDILGHSDQQKIYEGGCQVSIVEGSRHTSYRVFSNEMLSLLRANAFRDALRVAIEKGEGLAPLRSHIASGVVRIYSIGVGAAEPLATNDQSRRIEIRFATDRR